MFGICSANDSGGNTEVQEDKDWRAPRLRLNYSFFLFSSLNFSMPRQSVSMGNGNTIVELCSDEIALNVYRKIIYLCLCDNLVLKLLEGIEVAMQNLIVLKQLLLPSNGWKLFVLLQQRQPWLWLLVQLLLLQP